MAMEGTGLKKKDLKRFRDILLAKKKEILRNAQRTLNEDMTLDADDLPDEMDLASSEYLQSFTFRLRGREKVFLQKIDHALEKIKEGTFGVCEQCERADLDQAPRGAPRNHAVHPLQRRSGADRKSVRLAVASLAVLAIAGGGCAGPLAFEFGSASIGTHADGTLRHPDAASVRRRRIHGSGPVACHGARTTRPRNWSAPSCARRARSSATIRAASPRSATCRAGAAVVGRHKSHQSGRDIDVFFYGVDREGVRCRRATRCCISRPTGGRCAGRRRTACVRPAAAVPAARFDARRNWAFVRALLSDPEVEVQWIFIHRGLAAALLREATQEGDDPALVARASFIMRQPSDSEVARRSHAHPLLLRARRSAPRLRRQGSGALVEEDVEVHGRAVPASARRDGRARRHGGVRAVCFAASCR